MSKNNYSNKSKPKLFKEIIIKIILWFLGRGLQSCSRFDKNVQEELKVYDEEYTIMLKVWPKGPLMLLKKNKDRLLYKGTKATDTVDLTINFKSIESAFLLLTGQMGIDQGYAEHRVFLKGDIMLAMPLIRILNIVEAYLFPKFWAKRILKKMPKRSTNKFKIYLGLLLGL